MRAAKEKAKRSMTIQLDFAGRKITDYDASQDLDGMYDHGTHEHDDPNGMSSVDGTGGGGGGGGDYQYDPSAAPAMANNPLIGADRVMPTFTTPAASSSAGAGAARADADAGVAVAAGGGGTKGKSAWRTGRLQNDVLSVMVDNGKCLSMHQPWASLLVRGIKQHEGRWKSRNLSPFLPGTHQLEDAGAVACRLAISADVRSPDDAIAFEGRSWYSAHRGRLWIAATAKEVDPEEVEALQEFYKEYHADGGGTSRNLTTPLPQKIEQSKALHAFHEEHAHTRARATEHRCCACGFVFGLCVLTCANLTPRCIPKGQGEVIFPEHYPSACLLGCIDVDNVVSQEDYAETFEDGESSSPFVFLCKNPQELLMKFPIKGKQVTLPPPQSKDIDVYQPAWPAAVHPCAKSTAVCKQPVQACSSCHPFVLTLTHSTVLHVRHSCDQAQDLEHGEDGAYRRKARDPPGRPWRCQAHRQHQHSLVRIALTYLVIDTYLI